VLAILKANTVQLVTITYEI